ncbi:MAG: hypothetical protein H0X62_17000 [Bacteroidetes bacterium]|nr:hypothetical protein [Bacteroidota bacterium]
MGERAYRVQKMPDPEVWFGSYRNNTIVSKVALKSLDRISLYFPIAIDLGWEIIAFDLTVIEGKKEITKSSNSSLISQSQKALMEILKPGQKLIIENIKVRISDGSQRYLPPIIMEIK